MIDQSKLKERKVKVCPVILRESGGRRELLVFKHPQAGIQLVKGTLEEVERIEDAVLRELAEESGIRSVQTWRYLTQWDAPYEGQQWHFILCEVQGLPDGWAHFTQDGGGHEFEFFWHPLNAEPTDEWHRLFQDALLAIRHCFAGAP